MENRNGYKEGKLKGRPNQGKTGTIGKRTVDIYLPTEALMKEWRKAAEASGMSLSKYVLEVVERFRTNAPPITQSSLDAEKKINELEKSLADLGQRYATLDKAFRKVQEELGQLSSRYQRDAQGSVDLDIAKKIFTLLRSKDGEPVAIDELAVHAGANLENGDQVENFRRAVSFLEQVGAIENHNMMMERWKNGRIKDIRLRPLDRK